MYVFTENKEIVNLDRVEIVRVRGEEVIAVVPDDTALVLCKCESYDEAVLKVQEICTALDNCKRVFYIGSYIMPF